MTEEDVMKIKTRERPAGHQDLKNADLYIVPTRKACSKYNAEYIDSIEGKEIVMKAIHYNATQKNYKPFIEKKEGAIASTSFLDEIKIKIGCKVILIHNIDTSDGLTNGQLGTLVKIIYTIDGQPDKLIINLRKTSAGKENRKKFPDIATKYPDAVVIEKVSINYSMRKKKVV